MAGSTYSASTSSATWNSDGRGTELLFQVFTDAKNAAASRSRPTSPFRLELNLHRPQLCAAIVDRLTFSGNVIEFRSALLRPHRWALAAGGALAVAGAAATLAPAPARAMRD